jgi:hypothetical protein
MFRSCITCRGVASPDIQLYYCAQCQSAVYCSKSCMKVDWKEKHKQICKLLNVGHGDMQVRTDEHESQLISLKEGFERGERSLPEDMKQFFTLFQDSTFEGSRAAARNMNKISQRQTKRSQEFLLLHSLYLLIHSDLKMLSWPNSPLLVMLQFVDPNVLFGNEEKSITLLHYLAYMAAPSDYSTHEKQLILAKQVIEHGANVNAVSSPLGRTPLHNACYGQVVTNLDFVEYLLEAGADPNAQDHMGQTPLICTTPDAPGAAKYLLNWPTTDANVTSRSGASFLARVRSLISDLSDQIVLIHDDPDRVQHQFTIQQWRDIVELLVERGAADTGITTF